MNDSTVKILLKEYEQKRLAALIDLEKRKENLYSSHKRLKDIENELNQFALLTAKNILFSKDSHDSLNNFKSKLEILKKEKKDILSSLDINESFFVPNFECKNCEDTGYIKLENNYSSLCNCLKQKIFDIQYNKSNIGDIKKYNFNHFNINLYSNQINEDLYSSNISPRENVQNIKEIALSFVKNFDNLDDKNLLFTGNTGLGKTFLSNCIANELLKQGKTVLYQTAPVMLDTIIDYRFNRNNAASLYQNILDVDLLIIDDLGTECLNSMKFSELFNVINTRILNQNNHITKTIISTNLSLQNLSNTYDERIFSRFVGYYNICRFFGEDIRFKK